MKKLLLCLSGLCIFAMINGQKIVSPHDYGHLYAKSLGYNVDVHIDKKGNEYSVVVFPDNSTALLSKFLLGESKKKYSYCAKKGYLMKTEIVKHGRYHSKIPICKKPNGEVISMVDLLTLDGIVKYRDEAVIMAPPPDPNPTPGPIPPPDTTDTSDDQIINQFSWMNFNGKDYTTNITDQLLIGDCSAHAASACAEVIYNYRKNKYDHNVEDFSHCFISFCLSECSAYFSFYGGSINTSTLLFPEFPVIANSGIIRESEMSMCGSSWGCVSLGQELDRITFPEYGLVSFPTVGEMKQMILDHGAVSVMVSVTNWPYPYDGSYVIVDELEEYIMGDMNHQVALIGWGYDFEYGSYWLVRNSWGSDWGDNGIGKLHMSSSNVLMRAGWFEYGTPNINGPATVCGQGSTTYTLENAAANSTSMAWVISPSSLVTQHHGTGTSASTSPSASASGLATLTFFDDNNCGGYDYAFEKSIWIGPPSQPIILGPPYIECDQSYYYHVDWIFSRFDILWSKSPGAPFQIVSIDYDNNMIEILATGTGEGDLNISVTGDCNVIKTASLTIETFCYNPQVYPNPASSELIVDMSEFEKDGSTLSEDYEITIVGSDSRVYGKEKRKGLKEKYSVLQLPEGIASVVIKYKNKVYPTQVLIKR